MDLVLATDSLASLGGSESYLTTVAEQLERLGHGITIATSTAGEAAAVARARGLAVSVGADPLPDDPDAVIAQDQPSALAMAKRYPGAPRLFVCHSGLLDVSQPPSVAGAVTAVVVMSDFVRESINALAGGPRTVHRLTQPIDLVRFSPRGAISRRPRRALLFGNYLHGHRRERISRVFEDAGIETSHLGRHSAASAEPQTQIAQADIVVGYGRSVLEGMACGRAAYVLDHGGGDGWITPESWASHEAGAFAGRSTGDVIDSRRLASDLERYDPEMGIANRDLVLLHHNARRHAWSLIEILKSSGATDTPPGALDEMARLVRLAWRAEGRSLDLVGQLDALESAHVNKLEEMWDRIANAEAAAEAAQREASQARGALQAVRLQRRVQLANRLAAPLDRLRSARR